MVDRYYRKIEDVENDIENSMQISSILLKLKEYDDKLSDLGKIGNNENNISSNLEKINDIENDMKTRIDIYNETFIIPNISTTYSTKFIFSKIICSNFTADGIIKINAIYNYSYDKNYNFSHVYYCHNNGKQFKKIELKHNIISNVVNDKFDIQSIDSTEIQSFIYITNNNDHKKIELFDNNTIQVIYNETALKSDTNKNNISSNLSKINNNSSDITSNSGRISTNE